MKLFATLLRKELQVTFGSPIAYTVAAVFLLVLGYTFSLTLFATKVANLNYILHQMFVLSVLLVPAVTMRAFADERRSGSIELLLTAPVHEIWIVLAKFMAPLFLVMGMYGGGVVFAIILGIYGQPDWGPIISGYCALVLLACMLIALGVMMSSLTENQVIAAAGSIGIFLMLWFSDSVSSLLPQPFDLVAINFSLIGHFKPLVTGSVFLSDAFYFIGGTLFALFVTTQRLAER